MNDIHIFVGLNIENVKVKTFSHISTTPVLSNGTIVFDATRHASLEFPESSLHRSKIYDAVSSSILHWISKSNVYIFTHSDEVIRSVLRLKANNKEIKDVYVHHVSDDNSGIDNTFKNHDIKVSIEIPNFLLEECRDSLFWINYSKPDYFIQVSEKVGELSIYDVGYVSTFYP